MTFKIKISGAPSRHELTNYACPDCGQVTENFEDRSATPETVPCPNPTCDHGVAKRLFPGPKVGTNWNGEVVRGHDDERQHAAVMDTRALAEGMPMGEWKKKRREMYRDKDLAEIKQKAG